MAMFFTSTSISADRGSIDTGPLTEIVPFWLTVSARSTLPVLPLSVEIFSARRFRGATVIFTGSAGNSSMKVSLPPSIRASSTRTEIGFCSRRSTSAAARASGLGWISSPSWVRRMRTSGDLRWTLERWIFGTSGSTEAMATARDGYWSTRLPCRSSRARSRSSMFPETLRTGGLSL